MGRKYQTTTVKVTAELKQHLSSPVSTKTVRRELNKTGYHVRATIRKRHKRVKWCTYHKEWCADQCKQYSSFIFPTAGRAYVWMQRREAYNPDCFPPMLMHGGESLMVWAAVSMIRFLDKLNLYRGGPTPYSHYFIQTL